MQVSLSGFRFDKIVIVQSLEPNERQTGTEMAEFITNELSELNWQLPVEQVTCENFREFGSLLDRLEQEASQGIVPLLQIECHGDAETGLQFANGSEFSWEQLSDALRRINVASSFNLLAVVSACYGAHFLRQMGLVETSPCYAMISTTKEIRPSEIIGGFQTFYHALLGTKDLGQAVQSLAARPLSEGGWFAEPAEWWFGEVIRGYVQNHCSRRAVIERAKAINKRLREIGRQELAQRKMFEIIRNEHKELVLSHFNIYFAVHQVPQSTLRFKSCFDQVSEWVERIRVRGTHIL